MSFHLPCHLFLSIAWVPDKWMNHTPVLIKKGGVLLFCLPSCLRLVPFRPMKPLPPPSQFFSLPFLILEDKQPPLPLEAAFRYVPRYRYQYTICQTESDLRTHFPKQTTTKRRKYRLHDVKQTHAM